MILVTGATGHLGRTVIDSLLNHTAPANVAALVRDPSKATDLTAAGVSVRQGDYDDTAALDRAMQGVDTLLLISGTDEEHRIRQHGNVIDTAKRAGVRLIAYTSRAMKAAERSENNLMDGHFRTEELIRESGIRYLLFRNALYMDVLPLFLGGERVFETGIRLPAGDGKVAFALRSELGEAIANAMLEDVSESRVVLLTAHKAWSLYDVAAALTDISDKPVDYVPGTREAFAAGMRQRGVPEEAIDRSYGFFCDIRDGQLDEVDPELERLLGRQPAALADGLAHVFRLEPTRRAP